MGKIRVLAILILLSVPTTATPLTLTWVDNSTTEDGFIIEMLGTAGSWTEVARVSRDAKTYKDANEEGVYRVRAYVNHEGRDIVSLPSNVAGLINAPATLFVQKPDKSERPARQEREQTK